MWDSWLFYISMQQAFLHVYMHAYFAKIYSKKEKKIVNVQLDKLKNVHEF